MKAFRILPVLLAIFIVLKGYSQQRADTGKSLKVKGSSQNISDSSVQKDLIDVIQKIFDKQTSADKRKFPRKANFSVIPYGGYTLSTGFVADISGDIGFYTNPSHAGNYSIIALDLSYDTKIQKIFLTRSEIWTKNNNLKIVSDLRLESYPTDTYGLGTLTTFATDNDIDFNYLRVYETIYKKIGADFYGGIGYNLDYHYNITAAGNADNSVSDFQKYGQTSVSTSSGINFDLLFDNRKNPLNPAGGTYLSAIFRENTGLLGSGSNWQSLLLDFRKYFRLTKYSNNIIAVWAIAQFSAGYVPYLDLPATGGDMYNNSGRGYAVGRFRGKNELYFETEYRFGLTKNGLLGAVLFANAQSFSELQNNSFQKVAPAAGTGLRLKLNKHSNANICIDYGVGTGGSHGFFVNLGEVF